MSVDARQPDFSALGELNVVSNHARARIAFGRDASGGPQVDGGLLLPGDPMPENTGPAAGGQVAEGPDRRRLDLRGHEARHPGRGAEHRLRGGARC